MSLTVTTDPSAIRANLERVVAADPVRGTVLGSVLADIRDGRATDCWYAAVPGTDVLVARSARVYPAVFTPGWDAEQLAAAVELVAALPGLAGVSVPVDFADAVAAALGHPSRHRMAMRLFRLDELTAPPRVPGAARRATGDDRALIVQWYKDFAAEAGGVSGDTEGNVDVALRTGAVWLWIDGGQVASLAARRSPEFGSARIGPVYTPPDARGHGFGSAVTAAATRDVLDLGAVPVLFTDLANPTSNKIYQELGYHPVGDRVVIALG